MLHRVVQVRQRALAPLPLQEVLAERDSHLAVELNVARRIHALALRERIADPVETLDEVVVAEGGVGLCPNGIGTAETGDEPGRRPGSRSFRIGGLLLVMGLLHAVTFVVLPFVALVGLQWFYQMNSDGTGYLAQRTMACSCDREARRAAVVFTITPIVVRSLRTPAPPADVSPGQAVAAMFLNAMVCPGIGSLV